jgi:lipopolysaccharide export system permease protein
VIASRHLLREVLLAAAGIAAVLLLVTLGARAGGYLADAAAGRLSGGAVLAVLALRLPEFLALLLPLSFFLGLLVAFARLQAGSEITVLRAAGLGEGWFLGRLLPAAGVVGVLVAVLTLWLVPAANARIEGVLDAQRGVLALAALPPGRFQPLGDGARVARAADVDPRTGALVDVLLIEATEGGGRRLIRAERGALERIPETGARRLVLHDGRRWDLTPDGAVNRTAFARLTQRVDDGGVAAPPDDAEALATMRLVGRDDPAARTELHWRLALPVLVPVLVLLALPLARGETRSGGRPRLGLALVAFLGLFGALVAGRGAAADGDAPVLVALWLPLAVGAAAGGWMLRSTTRARPAAGRGA